MRRTKSVHSKVGVFGGPTVDRSGRQAPPGKNVMPPKARRHMDSSKFSTRTLSSSAREVMYNLNPALLLHAVTPSEATFRTAMTDAAYGLVDFPRSIWHANSAYGNMMLFIKSMRKGAKFDPEKFAHVDQAELRQMLEAWSHVRGPAFHFDMRWFYYMYGVFMAYVLYRWWGIERLRAKKMDNNDDSDLNYRWEAFGDDYEEDVRDQKALSSRK